ncbi:ABC transporter ATP-binding protein [Pelomonas sp. BJYL3]|uniref:ABC transporter ATP-binding protein n=1 Tax=Pelomonas sp. BJYL3 TaxID=2976697 RepID=UPI0022B5C9F8|nr:ABC transporter ATP-binding protein [Pelomonas sp. BJYL3]
MAPIVLQQVQKTYRMDAVSVPALRDISLQLSSGRFSVIAGASGSGKTTLLNIIGCLDQADAGEVQVLGESVRSLSDNQLADLRARRLGFVFQNFNLLPVLNAYENVEYPTLRLGLSAAQRRERVGSLLEAVGLAEFARHRPGQLSGGQRQRVAVARALANEPELVLADEPTANLDSSTGATIIALMRRLQRERGVSFVFSSHDQQLLAEADEVFHIKDGVIDRQEVRA